LLPQALSRSNLPSSIIFCSQSIEKGNDQIAENKLI